LVTFDVTSFSQTSHNWIDCLHFTLLWY